MAYATSNSKGLWTALRVLVWGGAAALLALPLIAMQFTSEVVWTGSDFAIAGAMLAVAVGAFEATTRLSNSIAYRVGVLGAVGTSILLFWVNGAVGFLGDEGNPANLIFLGVIVIAVLGSVLAGFRAKGMAHAMFAAAAAQALIGAAAIPAGWASPGPAGLYEVAMGSTLFVSLWLISGGLFRVASRERIATV